MNRLRRHFQLLRCSLALALVVAAVAPPGCASKPSASESPRSEATQTRSATADDGRLLDPIDNPVGQTRSMMVRAGLMHLGEIPYDGFALPLISPDGRFVATQTNAPPDWPTTLAEPGQHPPAGTTIEIYALDPRDEISAPERASPQRIANIGTPSLLGRGCDPQGVLVESPQQDGSRWIGKADWSTGNVQWLAQDDAVNAFAALSSDGRLAWCRRGIDQTGFDLVVRDIDGVEWTLSGAGGDWLMPVWSSAGSGLYALHRQDGRLRIVYGESTSADSFRGTMRDFTLMSRSDRYAAYQAFIGQGSFDGMISAPQPQVLVFHPGLDRVVLWKPLLPRGASATQLNARSLTALQQSGDSVIVGTIDELLLQSLQRADASIILSAGMGVPRRTPLAAFPYVVLAPGQGRVQITALKLLPIDSSEAAASSKASVRP